MGIVYSCGGGFGCTSKSLVYEHFIPPYCIMKPRLDDEIVKLCYDSWQAIVQGDTDPYKEAHEYMPSLTPIVFFYDTFYSRLFYICPAIKTMFKGSMKVQGAMLVRAMTAATNLMKDKRGSLLKKSLTDLAWKHVELEVHPQYFNVFVETLLETIEACLGALYTPEVHHAWLHALSLLLRVMVPVTVDGVFFGKRRKKNVFIRVRDSVGKLLGRVSPEEEKKEEEPRSARTPHSKINSRVIPTPRAKRNFLMERHDSSRFLMHGSFGWNSERSYRPQDRYKKGGEVGSSMLMSNSSASVSEKSNYGDKSQHGQKSHHAKRRSMKEVNTDAVLENDIDSDGNTIEKNDVTQAKVESEAKAISG